MSKSGSPEQKRAKLLEDYQADLVRFTSSLLDKIELADVTLVCGEEKVELKAHKVILMARLPAFQAIFEESLTDRVEIPDLKADVVKAFLKFLYTGQANNLYENSERLLQAIRKYVDPKFKPLAEICEQELIKKLSVPTVIHLLSFSIQLSLTALKENALAYCDEHAQQVSKHQTFLDLEGTNHDLFKQLVRRWADRYATSPRFPAYKH